MKPRHAFLTALALASCSIRVFGSEPIKLRADEWMPYNGDPSSDQPGYAIEILREIFKASGLDYQVMPWAEARKAADAGAIDAIVGCSKSEAGTLLLPSESIGLADVGLFAKAESNVVYSSVQSLKSVKLGAIEDYGYWDALDSYIKAGGDRVVCFKGEDPLADGIRALGDRSIDVFPENRYVFYWKLKKLGLGNAGFKLLFTYSGEPVYVAFSPKNPNAKAWAAQFTTDMLQMRRGGRLAQILAKYGMRDWKN